MTGCPYLYAKDAFPLLEAADLMEKGVWAPGVAWMDLPAALCSGIRYVWSQNAKAEARAIKRASK